MSYPCWALFLLLPVAHGHLRHSTDAQNSTYIALIASKARDTSDINNESKIDFGSVSNISNVSNVRRIEDRSGLIVAEHDCPLPPESRWCTLKAGKMDITMACRNKKKDIVCDSVCKTGFWEDGILKPLREKELPSFAGKVFLDVGVNVGVYSLVAASYGMKVVGFEPMPQNLALLHATFCANPLIAKNISLHEVALSNTTKNCSIVSYTHNLGNGKIDCSAEISKQGSNQTKQKEKILRGSSHDQLEHHRGTVSLDMLNNFLTGLGQITYAKIDIEGHECMMMKGGRDLLKPEHRPIYIQAEVQRQGSRQGRFQAQRDGCSRPQVLSMFKNAGYTIKIKPGYTGIGNNKDDYFMVDSNYSKNSIIKEVHQ